MIKPLPMAKPAILSYDPHTDGITNSLLTSWGGCRERARLNLRGWTRRGTSFALTYGDLTHWLLQHVYEDHRRKKLTFQNGTLSPRYVDLKLDELTRIWKLENPIVTPEVTQQMELTMMLNRSLMPFYFTHWKKDFTDVEWIGLESEFRIPFEVHRRGITYKTFLRGKRDGVFRQNKKTGLFETKTKSRIDEGFLVDILPFESQVNFYLTAIWEEEKKVPGRVRYNIVRRPGLRQKKSESLAAFAVRMAQDVRKRPTWYFLRQNMTVDPKELDRFRGELEDRVWEFIHWWKGLSGHWRESSQCQNQYGTCPMLSICSRGNFDAFFVRDRIFRELGEDFQ